MYLVTIMVNNRTRKPNGNVFKNIVRSVVKEELEIAEKRLKTDLLETFVEKVDVVFHKYRDDTLIKLDKAIGKLQISQEVQTAHQGQHEEINERLDKLEH